jgi:hypothetical protein
MTKPATAALVTASDSPRDASVECAGEKRRRRSVQNQEAEVVRKPRSPKEATEQVKRRREDRNAETEVRVHTEPSPDRVVSKP